MGLTAPRLDRATDSAIGSPSGQSWLLRARAISARITTYGSSSQAEHFGPSPVSIIPIENANREQPITPAGGHRVGVVGGFSVDLASGGHVARVRQSLGVH